MVQEVYNVFNTSRNPISFNVYPQHDIDSLMRMPSMKRRAAVKKSFNILIEHSTSIDLVERTGMSVKDLKLCFDLNNLVKTGKLMVLKCIEK